MVNSLATEVLDQLENFPRFRDSKSFQKFLLLPMVKDIASVEYLNDIRSYEVQFFINRCDELQTLFFIPFGSGFLISSDRPFAL